MAKLHKMVRVPRRVTIRGQVHRPALITAEEARLIKMVTDGRSERTKWGVRHFADDSASSKGVSRGDDSGTAGSGDHAFGSGHVGTYGSGHNETVNVSGYAGSENARTGEVARNTAMRNDFYGGTQDRAEGAGFVGDVGSGKTERINVNSTNQPKRPISKTPKTAYPSPPQESVLPGRSPDPGVQGVPGGVSGRMSPAYQNRFTFSGGAQARQPDDPFGGTSTPALGQMIGFADHLRAQGIMDPVNVMSAYRSKKVQDALRAANPKAAAAGRIAKDSEHTHGIGIDITHPTLSNAELAAQAAEYGGFRTVMGYGDKKRQGSHVHLGVGTDRPTKGIGTIAGQSVAGIVRSNPPAPASVAASVVQGRPVQQASVAPVPTRAPRNPENDAIGSIIEAAEGPRLAPMVPTPRPSPVLAAKALERRTPPQTFTGNQNTQVGSVPTPSFASVAQPGAPADYYGDEIDAAMRAQQVASVRPASKPTRLAPYERQASPTMGREPSPDSLDMASLGAGYTREGQRIAEQKAASLPGFDSSSYPSLVDDRFGPLAARAKTQDRLAAEQQINRQMQTNNANTSPPPSANAAVDPSLQYAVEQPASGVAIGPGPRGLRPATQPISTSSRKKDQDRLTAAETAGQQVADLTGTQGIPQNIDQAPELYREQYPVLESFNINRAARAIPSERDLEIAQAPQPAPAVPQGDPEDIYGGIATPRQMIQSSPRTRKGFGVDVEPPKNPYTNQIAGNEPDTPIGVKREGQILREAERGVNSNPYRAIAKRNSEHEGSKGAERQERVERRIARELVRERGIKKRQAIKLAKMILDWNITYSPMSV